MEHKEIKPGAGLQPYIHCFWELKGDNTHSQWERIFPDGCTGLVLNMGKTCITDNGMVKMDFGKTFAVGASTSFKDSFIETDTHLFGVCFKPGAFSNFYKYAPLGDITDRTVELEKKFSFNIDRFIKDPAGYMNNFFEERLKTKSQLLQSAIQDIHQYNGLLSINEIANRNCITVRQLERNFKTHIGLTPKEYSNIIRFRNALSAIKASAKQSNLLDIAIDCGFYDHSHLTNEIKRNTGLLPSQL